ncbi:MAG: zinc ribbon domain-containing protein [Lentisphaerae bacterium]|nr:zinc ribbon domain-containing protein [Lentisphaerota bacterium]
MPIYELYCPDCHTIFNFLSRTVNTTKRPRCPRCRRRRLQRQVSLFAATGRAREPDAEGMDDLPVDESKMEQALSSLAGEAERIREDDPRQAAQLMRKFTRMTGMELSETMEQALGRMEAGEDPEQVEADLGDAMENEEPFVLPGQKGAGQRPARRREPDRDPTLYEM